MKVAVLGGGIAGVLTARTLRERGYDVWLYEAAPRIGGLCRSESEGGFVADVAGGHVLHSRDRGVLDDMVATLGDSVETVRNTKIYYRGRWVKYPFENGLADLPKQDNFDCLKGYLDAYLARRDGAAEPDNFRDWIVWRFGEGIARHFMFPYNQKIWCVPLEQVSTAWVSGRIPEAPLEDVLRASLGLESEGYTHQSRFHYPTHGGFETLVHAYARGIEDRIRCSTPVERLEQDEQGWSVNGERYQRVVNSMPLKRLFPLLRPAAPAEVTASLEALQHLSLSCVLVAVERPALSPYSWVYFPHPETGPQNRITFLANYSPDNAPEGCSSILAEVTSLGGEGSPDLAAVEKQVVSALAAQEIVSPAEVRFTRSWFNEYAYPVYDHGFDRNIGRVLEYLDSRGLLSLGRFGRYRYVNTDQVVMMVREHLAEDFPPLG